MVYHLTAMQTMAINRIKSEGFAYAKVELEANLGREGAGACPYCDEGNIDCADCGGSGTIEREYTAPNGRELELTDVCSHCDGDGYRDCPECEGSGEASPWSDEACESFMLEHVSFEARQALTYGHFYYDGSVDSEYTFTLPIDKIQYAPEFVDAFKALADAIGNGMETDWAGMHISILPSGNYPLSSKLPDAKIENFKTEVTKLLPALYFAAAPGEYTRSLQYRQPEISATKHGHYPAICTHGDTCIEYRIFDTCYAKPEMLLENFEVIANTLKYYSKRKVNVSESRAWDYWDGGSLPKLFNDPDTLKALNQGLPLIKPKNKTITEMKKLRHVNTNVQALKKQGLKAFEQAKRDYAQYIVRCSQRVEGTIVLRGEDMRPVVENMYAPDSFTRYCRGMAVPAKLVQQYEASLR